MTPKLVHLALHSFKPEYLLLNLKLSIMANIHQQLLISAPVDKVFQAISSQEGLSGWWTPEATAQPEVNTIARFPFGPSYFKEMKITQLVPPKLVAWLCIHGDEQWVGTRLSFQLAPYDRLSGASAAEISGQLEQSRTDTGTVLTFHHDDWKDYTAMFAECSYTWGQFLRSLKLYCETGVGAPWPYQHRIEGPASK